MADHVETAMFVGDAAWHGLGTVIPRSLDVTCRDAIVMAGLDWRVKLVQAMLPDGRMLDTRAVVRESDNRILGEVGRMWTPLQPVEAFDWFDPIVKSGEVAIEAAGSLKNGQTIWILAAIKGNALEISANDVVQQYVLLSNDFSGKRAIRAGFTSIRVVCQNTLSAACENDASRLFKIRHSSKVVETLETARASFDVARAELKIQGEAYQFLRNTGCTTAQMEAYAKAVFQPNTQDADANLNVRRVMPLFDSGRGMDLCRGTFWAAFNACTEYTTHVHGRSVDNRVESQWFGKAASQLPRTLQLAVEHASKAA